MVQGKRYKATTKKKKMELKKHAKQIKKTKKPSSNSRYYVKACKERQGPPTRLSAWVTLRSFGKIHHLHFYPFRENQVLAFRFFLRMFLIVDFFNLA